MTTARERRGLKIAIIGAGPAGLYAGLLLKSAAPRNQIQIYERNPEDATYGWGVVFSDRTISTFRDADYPTFERISREFVIWTAIDIHYRDRIIRADGHDFAGMSRRRLLQILQERCRELEIELIFNSDVWLNGAIDSGVETSTSQTSTEDLRNYGAGETFNIIDLQDFDLVIAADGVNSQTRSDFSNHFEPRLRPGKAKYIWFGTDRVLDAFCFVFRDTQHGMFQAHSYPFDGRMSTFIVECPETVWRLSGLENATEVESISFCENLFENFLGGAHLFSNRSSWINFIHLDCARWRHQNLILLGDAAHTAHFSIGSGTKLAMDGAIALTQALEQTADLRFAAQLYELDRRPRAEALQAAARESQKYFENIKRTSHFEPEQFAFHLLTRSGRIYYDNLRTRDTRYTTQVDAWFAGGRPITPPPMFTPFSLRSLNVTNRIVIAAGQSGNPIEELHQAANRGAGLVMCGPIAVSAAGRITSEDSTLEGLSREALHSAIIGCHEKGSSTALLLNHAGRRGATRPRRFGLDRPLGASGWPLLAASPLPYRSSSANPEELDPQVMAAVCKNFVDSATLSDRLGFDLLFVNMAHGYLLAGFLSPLTNHRKDLYGGEFRNRIRFPLEIFEAIRAAWPAEKPIGVALNCDDWVRGGWEIEQAVEFAGCLKSVGCDLIYPLAGQTVTEEDPVYGAGFLTSYAERIRNSARIPVLAGGYLKTSGEINTLLAGGRADLCLLEIA